MTALLDRFLLIISTTLLQVSFVAFPVALFAIYKKSNRYLKVIPIVFVLSLIDQFSLISFFSTCWNWQGKIVEATWPLIVVYLLKWFTPKEVGYSLPKEKSGWLWGAGLGLVIASVGLTIDGFFGFSFNFPLVETLLYQFTMPGLAEEQVYRGIFLALFNRYFDRPWNFFHVKIGWGLILTTLLFAAVHVVDYSSSTNSILWNFENALPVFIWGFAFGWLREKTGSLWPSVLMHNFSNGFYMLGRWLAA